MSLASKTAGRRHFLSRCRRVESSASFLAVALLLAGCTPTPPTVETDAAEPTAEAGVGSRMPTPTPEALGGVDSPELTMWIVPEFDPDGPGGAALAESLAAFQAADQGARVDAVLKPSRGPTGIVAYLESTARVVPDQLPDVAIVPLDAIAGAVAGGWLQPLPGTVPQDRIDTAVPMALERSRDERGAWAVPVGLDVVHSISVADEPPATWSEVLDDEGYGIPAGGEEPEGLAPLLTFYGSAGGNLASLPAADSDAVSTTLSFLSEGAATGALVVPEGASSPRGTWNAFLSGALSSAVVSAGVFARQQANFPGYSWGPVAGRDGPAVPVAWGWALVIPTVDTERREAAAQLVAWLTSESEREWTVPAGYFPAQTTRWTDIVVASLDPSPDREYLAFLQNQLESARGVERLDQWGEAWAVAASDVLAGSPVDASAAAIAP